MKIEISEAFPEHFRPAYPEEFELFSHFETTAGIPSPLFAITTWKANGRPNVCFHAWSCFHGDRTAFFAVMGNLYQHTHTYANILREKCFALNFLPIACYDRLVETIRRNGMEEDEFEAGGFAAEGVSIASMVQKGERDEAGFVQLIFLTHRASEHAVRRALAKMDPAQASAESVIRVEE